jgi:DNA gyrase/topoisomerase IV subunit A
MAELVHEKRIEGISHIQDEYDKSGMRLVIELKRGEVPEVVLNNLYKQTQLQDTFGINMVALVNGQPKLCNLKDMIEVFLDHRREVVTRRTVYNLRKARERGHVLEGLAVALANIDDFIAIIRNAPTPPVAKVELMSRPWDSKLVREMLTRTRADGGVVNADDYRPDGLEREFGMGSDGLYRLSETQAQEILQMRLQRLTGLEQDKIVAEYKEVMAEIEDLLDILAKPQRVTAIITLGAVPLCLPKQLHALRFLSSASVLAILFSVGCIIGLAVQGCLTAQNREHIDPQHVDDTYAVMLPPSVRCSLGWPLMTSDDIPHQVRCAPTFGSLEPRHSSDGLG